jgi:hypothetical protein
MRVLRRAEDSFYAEAASLRHLMPRYLLIAVDDHDRLDNFKSNTKQKHRGVSARSKIGAAFCIYVSTH